MKEFLEMMADAWAQLSEPRPEFKYQTYENLVLAYGREFEVAVLHDVKGPDKECYRNTFNRANVTGLTYVEGYAVSQGIPILHAWLVGHDGVVYEGTWDHVGDGYFGVPMNIRWVNSQTFRQGVWGIICNDWTQKNVLLREGFPSIALADELLIRSQQDDGKGADR